MRLTAEQRLVRLIRDVTERALSASEAEFLFGEIMEGRASPVQMAGLLVALRTRGAVADEVAGGVRALRRAMVPVPVPPGPPVVDTCGTGGGALTTFNISTVAAFVAAGAGVRIAKHGNRSFTSRCGSADVLEALGIRLDLPPAAEARALEETGIVFMFAPLHHPAMRHIGPVRRELAMPTVMNVLGPLSNPAGAKRQVVGVADSSLLELIAGALQVLGHERALVVHGEPGLDELSPLGVTRGFLVDQGERSPFVIDPQADRGWPAFDPAELGGGSPEENAAMLLAVCRGEREGAGRAAVTLNAGAAIYVAGQADSVWDGVDTAEAAIRSGAAIAAVEALRRFSDSAAG